MIDVIKEYLVSLGMQVDKKSFNDAQQTIQKVEKGVKDFAGSTIKGFALAGTAIVSALASANVGLYAFLGRLATADLENEKFARSMGISKNAAEELTNTLKVMGATIEDLYLSPELMQDFHRLRASIKDMRPPTDFKEQMKFVRSVQFEFQQLRLSATYSLQWIGYHLFKYMEGPLTRVKTTLQGINKHVVKDMPNWTKKVAQAMSWIGRLGATLVKAGADGYRIFSELGERIPRSIKLIGAALLGLAFILKTGPFGLITAVLTGILLLLDDFYTYMEGGESALEPMWKKLKGFYDLLKDTGVIKRFADDFERGMRKAEAWFKNSWDWLVRLYQKFEDNGSLENFKEGVQSNFSVAKQVVQDFGGWVSDVFDRLNEEGVLSGLEASFVSLGKEISEDYKAVSKLIDKLYETEETKQVFQIIGDYLEGYLLFALESINDTIQTVIFSLKSLRALLTGDEALQEEANREFFGEAYDDQKPSGGMKNMSKDDLRRVREGSAPTSPGPQDTRLENSVNSLPRNLEPSFKKALNESELVKGIRGFNQDLNSGFKLLAAAINPDVLQYYQTMASGGYPGSYMYSSNATSNQTFISNDNRPVYHITSNDPKGVAREVEQTWSGINIRNMRPLF
ncbi:hypothetical protein NDK47_24055 [Brevibacillus ruminantium]|uniref:Phage tail tape measure protein n=1 Tax=Brevibacillus ruminantium TaxID=2950604 RepID=A0ABY4WDC3_9BACL|nr:hypothetical protein [Brevibacillus ruminantium]USG65160.1 hypothetical protein NDK47_24055 [Brevibacillus ruminantium]